MAAKAEATYQAIKKKFTGDPEAEQVLALAEVKPESGARQATLQEVLVDKMQADQEFAATVGRLIQEAKAADHRNVVAWGEGSVAIGGDATDNIIITGDDNRVRRS
ncbi:MAG TPA: hypothetical protein VF708_21065 [Pyrinomonadaceae bacterium]